MSETNVNVVSTPEYKEIIGTGRSGDFVLETQGGAVDKDFRNVSQLWLPKCITFEKCLENLEAQRSKREDIVGCWSDWEFIPNGKKIELKNQDGRIFIPTDYAIGQLATWCSIDPSHILKTIAPEFKPDELDIELLCRTLNHRKERKHFDNKEEERELLFRTYNDNTLRAVLTTTYGAIDNRWYIELLSELIPGGMVSHQRGDADSIYMNILIPDSIRFDTDSDYGGLFAVRNSEIGKSSLDATPALFRSICMNSNIWDRCNGINLRQVHKGEIKLDGLAKKIASCLDEQIKLVPEIVAKFLQTRQYEFSPESLTGVFAALTERFKLTTKQIGDVIEDYIEYEHDNCNAFGVINSVTRAGQRYDYELTEKFDRLGGQLINEDWKSIENQGRSYSENDLAKILGV